MLILTGGVIPTPGQALINNRSYSVHVFGAQNHQQPPEGTTIGITSDEADFASGQTSTVLSTNAHFPSMFDAIRPVIQGPYGSHIFELRLKDADPAEQENGSIEISLPNSSALSFPYQDNAVELPVITP